MFVPEPNPEFKDLIELPDWSIVQRHELDSVFGTIFDPDIMLGHLAELSNSSCPNYVFANQFVRLLQRSSEPILEFGPEAIVCRPEWSDHYSGEVHLRMIEILATRGYDDELIPAWKSSNGFQTAVSTHGVIASLERLATFFDLNREFFGDELVRCLSGRMYECELTQMRRAVSGILRTYPWHPAFAPAWKLLVGDELVFYDPIAQEALEALKGVNQVPKSFLQNLNIVRLSSQLLDL